MVGPFQTPKSTWHMQEDWLISNHRGSYWQKLNKVMLSESLKTMQQQEHI